MASSNQVKQYLAYWFQLGKRLKFDRGDAVLPQPVFQGNQYSPDFEAFWQQALHAGGHDCYLEGTDQTVAELLSSQWDLTGCARCGMPVPTINLGVQSGNCPCFDLNGWPNSELPQPRAAVDTNDHLEHIRDRLKQNQGQNK
jgi:hypothetical protein